LGFGAYQHDGGSLACGDAGRQLVALGLLVCGDSARAGDVFFSGQLGRFRVLADFGFFIANFGVLEVKYASSRCIYYLNSYKISSKLIYPSKQAV
jgi:hypothetical protein